MATWRRVPSLLGAATDAVPLRLDPATEAISLPLSAATETEYCRAALAAHHNEFWWYLNGTAAIRRYSAPFTDRTGRWWYQIKPGFAYPVNFFSRLETPPEIPWSKAPLGFQYPVTQREANSFTPTNVILDLQVHGFPLLPSSKQRAVRRGMGCLTVAVVNPAAHDVAEEARLLWNKHVRRTGWNTQMSPERFGAAWAELADWPGTTVITARENGRRGALCSWLIVRTIGDTIYLDTLASDSDYWSRRPNDTIIFKTLQSAARVGIKHAHFSLRSAHSGIERFKASVGFSTYPFPMHLSLRWPVGPLLRNVFPSHYRRLQGDPHWQAGIARS